MNVYDSARMVDVLAPQGFEMTEAPEAADLVILNTCHIREKAAEKVYSELGKLRALKAARAQTGGRMIIAVAGCVAQAEGDEMLRRAPQIDIVLGPQAYHRLPELVERATSLDNEGTISIHRGAGLIETAFPVESKFDHLPEESFDQGLSAFLTVQEGCDKFCTFCVVPYTRGAEYSRPADAIAAEARRLVAGGAREITLLGQNVNAYHGAAPRGTTVSGTVEWGLGRLIRHLAEIDGLDRIRYTTSHPLDMDEELISAHRDVDALMPFIHLPVQSGADRILTAMNRRHGADDYRHIVDRLRAARPDIALSSDFIVGFPGETDRDFEDTLTLVGAIGFAQAFSFKYSPRPGTGAAEHSDQITDDIKGERLARLQALLKSQQTDFNRASIGKVMPVLLDRPGRHPGQLVGRSPYLQAVHATAPAALSGQIVEVRVRQAEANSLSGVLVDAMGGLDDAAQPGARASA